MIISGAGDGCVELRATRLGISLGMLRFTVVASTSSEVYAKWQKRELRDDR
jgi:hypothetical protein